LKPETDLSIESIVRDVYQNAVDQGVDAASRPNEEANYEAWALKCDALDRSTTRAVQALLNPLERKQFDQRLIGIMDISIGVGDCAWHGFIDAGNAVVLPSGMTVRRRLF
jgi:hypothetical protein